MLSSTISVDTNSSEVSKKVERPPLRILLMRTEVTVGFDDSRGTKNELLGFVSRILLKRLRRLP